MLRLCGARALGVAGFRLYFFGTLVLLAQKFCAFARMIVLIFPLGAIGLYGTPSEFFMTIFIDIQFETLEIGDLFIVPTKVTGKCANDTYFLKWLLFIGSIYNKHIV